MICRILTLWIVLSAVAWGQLNSKTYPADTYLTATGGRAGVWVQAGLPNLVSEKGEVNAGTFARSRGPQTFNIPADRGSASFMPGTSFDFDAHSCVNRGTLAADGNFNVLGGRSSKVFKAGTRVVFNGKGEVINSFPPTPVPAPQARNLALGKPTTQSSTYSGTGVDQGPQLAVDGKRDGRDPHDLIMTRVENQPWWQVDLQQVCDVDSVSLYNRHNPPELGSSKDIQVLVSLDEKTWSVVHSQNGHWQTLNVKVGRPARYVRVQLAGKGGISLYEVEVHGH